MAEAAGGGGMAPGKAAAEQSILESAGEVDGPREVEATGSISGEKDVFESLLF